MRKSQTKRRSKKAKGRRTILAALCLCVLALVVIALYIKANRQFADQLYPTDYREIVEAAGEEFSVDPGLIFAVIRTESNFKNEAVSGKQAKGLMQITDPTFDFICFKHGFDYTLDQIYEPEVNIRMGTAHLSYLIKDFDGVWETALAAYNAGRGRAKQWLEDSRYSDDGKTLKEIPYNETRNYVKKVMDAYTRYHELYYEKE